MSLTVAAPPLAGALVVVAVLMGPTGMQPSDAAMAMSASPLLRAAVWVAWLAALAPAAIELGRAETGYLRWLPVPRAGFVIGWTALLALINAPVAVFWVIAAGAEAGLAVAALTVAFHGALLGRGPLRLAMLGATAAALIAAPTPTWQTGLVGLAIAALALPLGWRDALEGRAFSLALEPAGRPARAIATLLVNDIAEPLVLLRVLVAAIVFGGLGGLLVRANDISSGGALLVAIAVASMGSVGVAAHVANRAIAAWRELRWVLRCCGARPGAESLALTATTALAGAACGAVVSAAAMLVASVPAATWTLATLGGAACAASITVAATALAARSAAGKSTNAWLASLAVASLLIALLVLTGALALMVVPGVVALGAVYTHEVAASAEIDA